MHTLHMMHCDTCNRDIVIEQCAHAVDYYREPDKYCIQCWQTLHMMLIDKFTDERLNDNPMSNHNVMREFRTPNFIVRISAKEEYDLDLSFDETGRVQKQLENGSLIAFCAHVEVIHRQTGAVLGEDYLGDCIYKSFGDFMDHRACGRQNRKWAKQGKEGQCGSYFAQMISEAISEARKELKELQTVKVRN